MFFGGKSVVALDIGTSSIKLAEMDVGPRGATLKKFAVYPLRQGQVSGGEILEGAGLGQAISEIVKAAKSKSKNVVSALWGNAVIIKKITMPAMAADLVAEQIKWEAEQYIPFDINEVSLDYHILKGRGTSESMDVLLVAAKQEFIFHYLEAIESANLRCSILDVSSFALANCFELNYGLLPETVALMNVGAGVTNLVVVDRGDVIFARDVPAGGGAYTGEIHKSMGVSLDEAEALKISASLGQEVPQDVNNIIAATNDQVVDEIRNSIEFFNATSGSGSRISRLFVSGGSIFVPGLADAIAGAVGVPYTAFDPFAKIGFDQKALSADYIGQIRAICPVAMGLAMRKVGD